MARKLFFISPVRLSSPTARIVVILKLVVGLSASARGDEHKLFDAILLLDHPVEHKAAERTIRKAGIDGLNALVTAGRIGGEGQALTGAAAEMGCGIMKFDSMIRQRRSALLTGRRLQERIGRLAVRMLVEDPEVQEIRLRSPISFERRLALVSLMGQPQKMLPALESMFSKPDPLMADLARRIFLCQVAERQPMPPDLVSALKKVGKRRRPHLNLPLMKCRDPSSLPETLVSGLEGGLYGRPRVWDGKDQTLLEFSEGDSFSMVDTEKFRLSPECVLVLYGAVAQRGRYLPDLLLKIFEQLMFPPLIRSRAAQRLAADLKRYNPGKQNRFAARLVNAGYRSPIRIGYEIDRTRIGYYTLLEAAARQGSPGVEQVIEKAVFCRDSESIAISLLGFLNTSEAAEQAAAFAELCPDARAAATIALIRLGDKRVPAFLSDTLRDPGFYRKILGRTIVRHYSPEIGAEIKRLASTSTAGVWYARKLLKVLQTNGLPLP